MTLPELRNGIAQLLAQADTPGAMKLMHHFATQHGRKDVANAVVALQGRFGRLRSDNARGVLAQSDLDLSLNKINNSIVELLDQLETQPKIVPAVWARVGVLAGIMALVAGFLLFKYLPERHTTIASMPPIAQPAQPAASDAVRPPDSEGSSLSDVKKMAEPQQSEDNSAEKPETKKNTKPSNQQNPQTTPYKPSNQAAPAPEQHFAVVTLVVDSPWNTAAILVDGAEAEIIENGTFTKKIKVAIKPGNRTVALRRSNGKECVEKQIITSNTTLYFNCP